MKRFLILLLLCATLIGIGATRHPKRKAVVKSDPRIDSITFARAEWQNDTLDGFILHRHQFKFQPLFASPQNICYIELPPNSPRKIFFAADTILTTVSQQAQHHDALAAVNGSYFDMDLGNPVSTSASKEPLWAKTHPAPPTPYTENTTNTPPSFCKKADPY